MVVREPDGHGDGERLEAEPERVRNASERALRDAHERLEDCAAHALKVENAHVEDVQCVDWSSTDDTKVATREQAQSVKDRHKLTQAPSP